MKILIYSNQGLAPLHLGIELETIEKLKKEKHDLNYVYCNNQLEGCFFNPCHNLLGCAICEGRREKFYNKIGVAKNKLFPLIQSPKVEKVNIPFFETVDDLISYTFEEVNIGRGVASSIISIRRDFNINSHNSKEFIAFQMRMALNVYFNFKNFIQKFQPDCIYLFNGRFAECHPILGLCKKMNIKYKSMEVSSSKMRYEVYDNHLPHSIKNRVINMNKRWENADKVNREQLAQQWFESRRFGKNITGKVYVAKQKVNELPEGFDENKINIGIFNSSEDEMKVIEEWTHDLYSGQNEVIENLANHFSNNPKVHFYLRVHPNLGEVDNEQSRGIKQMNFPNLTIIPPFSKVDTYALMQICDKTLTFGSTAGIEATFWGKPSILFGKSFFDTLDCLYRPADYQSLYDLITTPSLPPKPKENTYMHGYHVATYGKEFKDFKYNGKFDSHYKGEHVKRSYPVTFVKFLKFLGNFPKWWKYNKIVRSKNLFRSNIWKLK